MIKVILVGTLHPIQRDKTNNKFKHYIYSIVNKYSVKSIAEEIDNYSIPQDIAKELGLTYVNIEPTPEERNTLQIPSIQSIKHSIFMDFDNDESISAKTELNSRLQISYREREKVWLKRINHMKDSPILSIIGANHFEPFSSLLRENGYEVIQECTLWNEV